MNFICFSLFRHDENISSTAREMALELSKKHRVFFIEHPVTYKDILLTQSNLNKRAKNDNSGKGYHVKDLHDQLYIITPPPVIPINFLPEGRLYQWFRRINENRLLGIVENLMKTYDFSNYVFINFYAPVYFQNFPASLRPASKIYYVLDAIDEVAYTKKHGVNAELEQVKSSDVVLCSSKNLYKKYAQLNNAVHYLPNGANVNLYRTAVDNYFPLPDELKNFSTQKIGYIGSIDYRMDFELVQTLSEYHKEKTFFFLGPMNTNELPVGDNIIHIQPKLPEQLPAYLQHFDCLIIPFKKNKLTAAIYPLKLNEYLASGKPIVTTGFSEDLDQFKELIVVANDEDDFIKGIFRVLDTGSLGKQDRINKAIENSWENRVEALLDIMKESEKK